MNDKYVRLLLLITACLFFLNATHPGYAEKPHCIALNQTKNVSLPVNDILNYVDLWIYQQSNVPAVLVGIVVNNESILISCGETEIGNRRYPQGDTIWQIGSVSKVITTTILAQMLNTGKITLTDPIEKYYPQNTKFPTQTPRKITLLDLATHTSGLDRSALTDKDNPGYQNQKTYDEAYALQWLSQTKLLHEPGTYYLYSNFAFGLLGQALAHAEKISFGQLVDKYITKGLGMSDTTTQLTPEQKQREAKSYWMNSETITTDWPFDFEAPSGGIYSTGNDLIKFIQYHLQRNPTNQVNHASYVYQNDVQNPLTLKNSAMSLGWQVDFPHQNLPVILNKNGWVSGFNTWVLILPTKHVGIFSISNKPYLTIDSSLRTLLTMVLRKKAATH